MVRTTRPDYTKRRMSSGENVEDASIIVIIFDNFTGIKKNSNIMTDLSVEIGVINLYL